MKVLDASVIIAWLDTDDAHHVAAVDALEECLDEDLFVSVITLAEVLVGSIRTQRESVVRRALDDVGVQTVAVPAESAGRLAALRAETGLRMPDCCVLLTAEHVGGSVVTFDQRLAASAENVLGSD